MPDVESRLARVLGQVVDCMDQQTQAMRAQAEAMRELAESNHRLAEAIEIQNAGDEVDASKADLARRDDDAGLDVFGGPMAGYRDAWGIDPQDDSGIDQPQTL